MTLFVLSEWSPKHIASFKAPQSLASPWHRVSRGVGAFLGPVRAGPGGQGWSHHLREEQDSQGAPGQPQALGTSLGKGMG